MSLYRGFSLIARGLTSKRFLTTSAPRLSDNLFVHRNNDPDVDKFDWNAENRKVCIFVNV